MLVQEIRLPLSLSNLRGRLSVLVQEIRLPLSFVESVRAPQRAYTGNSAATKFIDLREHASAANSLLDQ